MNLDRHICEGWTARRFIEELEPIIEMIMEGMSWLEPFKDKKSLNAWLKDNQPYYKKPIKEVQDYYAKKYNLK